MQQDYLQIRVFEVSPQVTVSGQLFGKDIELLARQGVRSIVSNRVDRESPGQPLAAELAAVAEECGITFVHFPVGPGPISADSIDAFSKLCDELERPLHLFSRSGGRSIKIWELAESF